MTRIAFPAALVLLLLTAFGLGFATCYWTVAQQNAKAEPTVQGAQPVVMRSESVPLCRMSDRTSLSPSTLAELSDVMRRAIAEAQPRHLWKPGNSRVDEPLTVEQQQHLARVSHYIAERMDHGTWTTDDRETFNQLLAALPPPARDEAIDQLLTAVNTEQIAVESGLPLL